MAKHDPQAQAAHVDKVLAQVITLAGAAESLRKIEAQKSGLPLSAYNLLSCVASFAQKGCTVSQAAQKLGIRPQALNTPAALLAKEGLLSRERDRIDSRAKRLIITAKGAKRLSGAQDVLDEFKQEIARQIPAANVASLFLGRLEEAAQRVIRQNLEPDQA